jgi:hypothetical protein
MNLVEIASKIDESNLNSEQLKFATYNGKQFKFITRTRPKLNKKNRTTKEPTTFSVEIKSEFTASLGVNYQNEVNMIRESQGLSCDFEAKKAPGKHYAYGTNWLMEADNTPGKFYIALSKFENRTTTYLIDGVPATPEQIEDLKINYLPKSSSKPSPIEWKTYSIDSIESVEQV